MKVIVHIGTEKTGTTSIQQFLYQNRRKLRRAGYHFLQSAGKINNRALPAICIGEDRFDDFFRSQGILTTEDRRVYRERLLSEIESEINSLPRGVHTVLISSEHFHSRIRTEEEMDAVHAVLTRFFDGIRVICYLREQVTTCSSYYSTSLKSGGTESFSKFMQRCAPSNYYFNYLTMLANWERCFGFDALDVALFDKSRFLNGDLLDDFSARVDPALVGKLNKKIQIANESLSTAGQALALGVNQAFPIRTARAELAVLRDKSKKLIYQRLKGKGRRPSLETQREMFQAFGDCNEDLRKKFFPDESSLFELPHADPSEGFELDDGFFDVLTGVLDVIKNDGRGLLDPHEYSAACTQVISTAMEMASEDSREAKPAKTLTLTEDDARQLRRVALKVKSRSLSLALRQMAPAEEVEPSLPGASARRDEYRDQIEKPAGRKPYMVTYYYGGDNLSEEDTASLIQRCMQWLISLETEGAHFRKFTGMQCIRRDDGVATDPLVQPMGYTILLAESLEAALEEVRNCPGLEHGMTMDVAAIDSPLAPVGDAGA